MTVAALELRDVMGRFATGVAVVTTKVGGKVHGMTVNSLTSVSLDPPLLLVCLHRDSRTAAAVTERGAFVVNLLSRRQEAISDRFARTGTDHFEGLDVELIDDLPVIGKGLGHLVCEVDTTLPGGDHVIVVGRVVRCVPREDAPLVFYRGRYHDATAPGREAEIDWYW